MSKPTLGAYYNEIDGFACDWLQNLMDAGQITPGRIDDRDIREVQPEDLAGYERVHWLSAGTAPRTSSWSGCKRNWTTRTDIRPLSRSG